MKLVPVTVTVLPWYADVGAMEVAVGAPTMVRGVPETVVLRPCVNNSSTEEFAICEVAPITTITWLSLRTVHVDCVPALGIAPTFAEHSPLLAKFWP